MNKKCSCGKEHTATVDKVIVGSGVVSQLPDILKQYGIEKPFIDYVLPLIQGESASPKENSLPRFAKLKKVLTVNM